MNNLSDVKLPNLNPNTVNIINDFQVNEGMMHHTFIIILDVDRCFFLTKNLLKDTTISLTLSNAAEMNKYIIQ